jgi:hypothetical protein
MGGDILQTLNEIIKFVAITAISFLIFNKIKPIEFTFWRKILIGASFVVLITASLYFLKFIVEEPYKTIAVSILSSVYLAIFTRDRFEVNMTSFIISYAASYVLYLVSIMISAFIMFQFGNKDSESIFLNGLAFIISLSAAFALVRIKINLSILLKKGVGGIFLFISGIIFLLYSMIRENISYKSTYLMMAGFCLIGYGIYSWFRRETTIARNEDTNEVIKNKLQAIIDEKESDIEFLRTTNDYISSAAHKDNKKLDAIQRAVEKLIMRSQQTDILLDAQKALEGIQLLREQSAEELKIRTTGGKNLPLTGLQFVDAKFEVLLEESVNKQIDFNLNITGDIKGIDKTCNQLDLVNIIGDLVANSFVAIRHLDKNESYRNILFFIKKDGDVFELSAEDSGIPFETDILVNLGINRVTSHANDGGSGYGYETIFENLKKYGASLTITEYKPTPSEYTKKVAIRLDGKGCYTIISYRIAVIKKQNVNKNLILLDMKG